ncbi:hypothetical protein [Streptomyces sp. NPDC102476]|uniref:hypothetical protein n=1 Tax=Streptomyces sp. NPDC102476 TaxID=3366181 RepID=UPI00381EDEE8
MPQPRYHLLQEGPQDLRLSFPVGKGAALSLRGWMPILDGKPAYQSVQIDQVEGDGAGDVYSVHGDLDT